jgi:hypothetical protein
MTPYNTKIPREEKIARLRTMAPFHRSIIAQVWLLYRLNPQLKNIDRKRKLATLEHQKSFQQIADMCS